jgi:Sjoegren syndrome nuclear autoantigen 1
VACIEDLREKREELNRSLLRDEEEKSKIQKELSTLTERLSRLNEDLARKMQVRSTLQSGVNACALHAERPPCLPLLTLTLTRPLVVGFLPLLPLQARVEFDQTIQETEAAYMKILESSQTLLSVLKRESVNLTKRKTATS